MRLPLSDHLRESGRGRGQEEGASDALFGGDTPEGWGRGLVHCLSMLCSSAINSARAQEHVSTPGGTGPDVARWVFPMAKTVDSGQLRQLMAVAAGNVVRLTTKTLRLCANDLTFLARLAVVTAPKCSMGQPFGKMVPICVGGQKEGGPTILSHFCLPQTSTGRVGSQPPSPKFTRLPRPGEQNSLQEHRHHHQSLREHVTTGRQAAAARGTAWRNGFFDGGRAKCGRQHKSQNPLQTGQRDPRRPSLESDSLPALGPGSLAAKQGNMAVDGGYKEGGDG